MSSVIYYSQKKATKAHPVFGCLDLRGLFLFLLSATPAIKSGGNTYGLFLKFGNYASGFSRCFKHNIHTEILLVCQCFFDKVGMQFTQPATRCRMWPWKSLGILFPALIILEPFKSSIAGLALREPVFDTSVNLDGLRGLFARAAERRLKSRP